MRDLKLVCLKLHHLTSLLHRFFDAYLLLFGDTCCLKHMEGCKPALPVVCLPKRCLKARAVFLQLWKGFRQHHYVLHRRLGKLTLAATALGSLSAAPYALSYLFSAQIPETVSSVRLLLEGVTLSGALHNASHHQTVTPAAGLQQRASHACVMSTSELMWQVTQMDWLHKESSVLVVPISALCNTGAHSSLWNS